MSAWQSILHGFDFNYLLSLVLGVLPSLLCITLHELSHGLVAFRLGDDTARRAGRLTLNPLKHLDPMGLLMMLVFHFGWAKPVPVNMMKFRDPKRGMAVTALAGPACNLLITAVFLFLYGLLLRPLSGNTAGKEFEELRMVIPVDPGRYLSPEITEYTQTLVTIREGKYHQIKRMFAAVGKKVLYLKRLSMGPLRLDPALEPGQFRKLTEEEIRVLQG